MCAPRVTHRTSLVVKKKNFFSFPVAVNISIKVGPLVYNHEEHYETPCTNRGKSPNIGRFFLNCCYT